MYKNKQQNKYSYAVLSRCTCFRYQINLIGIKCTLFVVTFHFWCKNYNFCSNIPFLVQVTETRGGSVVSTTNAPARPTWIGIVIWKRTRESKLKNHRVWSKKQEVLFIAFVSFRQYITQSWVHSYCVIVFTQML